MDKNHNTTPLSQHTLADELGNLTNLKTEERTSVQDLLVEARYTLLEIQNITRHCKQKCDHGNYGRCRPRTQVFWQGRTFTYEKLEIDSPGCCKTNHNARKISAPILSESKIEYSISNLNPEAPPFTSGGPKTDSPGMNNPTELNPDALSVLKNIRMDNLKRDYRPVKHQFP